MTYARHESPNGSVVKRPTAVRMFMSSIAVRDTKFIVCLHFLIFSCLKRSALFPVSKIVNTRLLETDRAIFVWPGNNYARTKQKQQTNKKMAIVLGLANRRKRARLLVGLATIKHFQASKDR